jgi:hypothetical protein
MLRALRTRFAIFRLCRAVERRARRECAPEGVTWFGAYEIHPKHLAIWIQVRTDEEKNRLQNNPTFMSELRDLLDQVNYPIEGRTGVGFGIASQEEVDRDYGGNWWHFFK